MAYQRKPLDACFERVRRAEEHIADFEARVEIMFQKQANALGITLDPQPPHHVKENETRLPSETFYDMRFAVLIGEICHNLRSALDCLIFELAKLDTGQEQENTQFPLADTAEKFASIKALRKIDLLTPEHVAKIEGAQPYRCDWSKRLRDCSNLDKHRKLISTMGSANFHVHSSLEKDLWRCFGYERMVPHPVAGRAPVKVKVYISRRLDFPDGAPVLDTIKRIKRGVAEILNSFEPDFKEAS
jgi:hypothetical protein